MSESNFVICVRNSYKKGDDVFFGNEPGPTRYLEVPDNELPHPIKHKVKASDWLKLLLDRATTGSHDYKDDKNPVAGYAYGDILVFIHGYNNSIDDIMTRHNLLQKRLKKEGFKGAIVSFDWPSASKTLNYLEDRADAKATALRLVKDCITVLAKNQLAQDRNKCDIDVHLLCHSTGAYVVREAFYEADHNRTLSRVNWNVSQVAFIGGDIAKKSLSITDNKSKSLFKHSIRITNYQNPFDSALKVSNVKRLGTAPRVGRVGVPNDTNDSVVNVLVDQHWQSLDPSASEAGGNWSHSWHFDDELFARDLVLTLEGDIDRHCLPTRKVVDGRLVLSSLNNE